MNYKLSKEQERIVTEVREFAEKEIAPIAEEIDRDHRFPTETVERMAELGLLGLPFPKKYGGAGADNVSYALAINEVSKKCAASGTIMAAHNSLCCWPIFAWGTEEQKQKYLPDLLSGKKLGAFGLTEPNAGSDASAQRTQAKREGDDWVLNGSKVFITNGGYASVFVVMAMTDKSKGNRGISAFIVEKGDPGFSIGKTEDKMGICASSTTELVFQNCRIPAERILGNIGDGFKVAMSTLDGGRIGCAAQAAGIAKGALECTIKYLKSKKAGGRALSQQETVRFDIAEMAAKIEASNQLFLQAAFFKDQNEKYGILSAMAKMHNAETAMYVTTKCVQLQGVDGYVKGNPVERMMRDAKITEIYEGTSEIQKTVIASAIIGK